MHRGASTRILGDTGLTGWLVGRRTWGNNLGHFRPVRVNITNGHGHRVDAKELSLGLNPLSRTCYLPSTHIMYLKFRGIKIGTLTVLGISCFNASDVAVQPQNR